MTALTDVVTRPALQPMEPRPFRVQAAEEHTHDTVTLTLEPLDGEPLEFAPGQFTMLGAFGVGEVPISISGDAAQPGILEHTVRDVGGVTHVLARSHPGDVLTVRGPYGTSWNVAEGKGGDVVVVAGGIGLAPLRPSILEVLGDRTAYQRFSLLYGARSPGERLFRNDLARWAAADGMAVEVSVDHADSGWPGRVGLVTTLIPLAEFDPERTLALVCGPEVMIRFVSAALMDLGVPASSIKVSLERNMKCGIGLCGHCQLRELFVCADGPVFGYDAVADLMALREY